MSAVSEDDAPVALTGPFVEALARIREVVGAEHVLERWEQVEPRAQDTLPAVLAPSAIVSPANVEEARAVVRIAYEQQDPALADQPRQELGVRRVDPERRGHHRPDAGAPGPHPGGEPGACLRRDRARRHVRAASRAPGEEQDSPLGRPDRQHAARQRHRQRIGPRHRLDAVPGSLREPVRPGGDPGGRPARRLGRAARLPDPPHLQVGNRPEPGRAVRPVGPRGGGEGRRLADAGR